MPHVRLRPLLEEDARLFACERDAAGDVHLDVADSDDTSLWSEAPRVLCTSKVLLIDRHRMVVPLHWPFRLLALLLGNEQMVLYLTSSWDAGEEDGVEAERFDVVMRDVHLFHTPPYRELMGWLLRCDGTARCVDDVEYRTTDDAAAVVRTTDQAVLTWSEWFARHPRYPTTYLRAVPTVRRRGRVSLVGDERSVALVVVHDDDADGATRSPAPKRPKHAAHGSPETLTHGDKHRVRHC